MVRRVGGMVKVFAAMIALSAGAVRADGLRAIVLEGSLPADSASVAALLPWTKDGPLPDGAPQEAARLVERALRDAGWWGAIVRGEMRGSPPDTLVLHGESGEPVVVGEVRLRGHRVLAAEEILARVDLRAGAVFDATALRRDAARVLRAYSERGHPLARVYPSRFEKRDDGRLLFTLRIGEGPRTYIESVRVFGECETSASVIARLGGVRPGDRWNVARVEEMATRLRREGLFESVSEPRVVRGSRDDRVGLELEIREGPASSFFGVLGYTPASGGGGELVGLVDLSLGNILGTARRAGLRLERSGGGVQDFAFRFREPWIPGTSLSLEGGAAQSVRDTLYSRTDLDLTLGIPLGARSVASVVVDRRRSSFTEATGDRVSETSVGGAASVSFEGRDRRFNPGSGGQARILVGSRRAAAGERRTRLEAGVHALHPFGRRWVFSQEAGARGVRQAAGSVPLYAQYWVGGTNTVRGYEEERFHGDIVWWTRTELRYRVGRLSRVFAFVDVGGARSAAAGLPAAWDTFPGGGFGAALESAGSGVVRIEFAMGRGDAFSEAKVHAGLEREF
ncbi:MAG: BamA/TamA family outer membrane protein [Gemmatimonadota bacterium]|jgi:outer membrane protein insertion porin family|nr:BamA/TamA family outer membrane protein [Gemmatimonadota bacterium]